MTAPPPDVTHLLLAVREAPTDGAREALLAVVYPELRRMAASLMRRERPNHTLQPTALAHEAYLALVDQAKADWQCRAHFFGAVAGAMRRILVDHARARAAAKRGGGVERITFDEALGHGVGPDASVLVFDDLLERFARVDPRSAQVVELRVFGGLTVREVAETLNVSQRTVDYDWSMARMWLGRELGRHDAPPAASDAQKRGHG